MAIYHSQAPEYVDPSQLYTGELLTGEIGTKLWRNWLYLNSWQMQSHLFTWNGPPDNAVNLGCMVNTNGMFFPIVWSAPREDAADRRLCVRIIGYGERANSDAFVKFYDGVPWAVPGTTVYELPGHFNDYTSEYGWTPVKQLPIEIYADIEYTPDATGDFKALGLEVEHIQPGVLSIWEGPTQKLTPGNARSEDVHFSSGEPIRGYTSGTDATGSLGHLRHWVGDGSDDEDWIERNTRRCYFQTGHHNGIWSDTTSAVNIFQGINAGSNAPFSFRIKARNLLGATTGGLKALPALVVSAPSDADGAGCEVVFTSARTSDTWTYQFTGGEASTGAVSPVARATLVKPTAGTTSDLDVFDFSVDEYDYITVTAEAASGKELVIHTVSLWEDAQW